MTVRDINTIIETLCPNDEDYEKPCISPKYLRQELEQLALEQEQRYLEQEPKTGHWITKPHVYGVTYCSECDFELKIDNTNYCPNCGAKMEEVEE